MGRSTRALLAVTTGVLAWVSFPSVGAWPLAFVAWVPLLLAIDGDVRPSDAALYGWLAGLTMTGLGLLFVLSAVHRFGGLSIGASILVHLALSSYEGLRIALVALVAARARKRGWPSSFAFLLAFAGSEVAFPEPFPWTFGASVHHVPPLAQVADLGGAPLVSVIIVASSIALQRALAGRWAGLGWLALPLASIAYGVVRVSEIDDAIARAPAIAIGIVQPHLEMFHVDSAAEIHVDGATALRSRGARLVVFSEAPLPGPYPEEDLDGALQATVTSRLGVPAIVGITVRRDQDDGTRVYFNSAVLTDDAGKAGARYDKHRLLPFGEYIPLAGVVPALRSLSPKSGEFSPGTSEPLDVPGPARPTITICYEDVLPELVRALVSRERPNLLVNMTNDGWFEGTSEPRVHLELARARAIEHRRYLVRATNSGVSAIIDPAGRSVVEATESQRTTLLANVGLMESSTIYETLGDGPAWGALGAVVALGFVTRPRGRRQPPNA